MKLHANVKPILYVATGILLGSFLAAPQWAGAQTWQMALSQVRLLVNGSDKTPTDGTYWNGMAQVPIAFEYQGTTYMPVRYISESLGQPVQWDQATRTISIGKTVTAPSTSSSGDTLEPDIHQPVTFVPKGAFLYDTGDSQIIQYSFLVTNNSSAPFFLGSYLGSFVSTSGAQYDATLYAPQGTSAQVEPQTSRLIQYYATIPSGFSTDHLQLQLTKADFSSYPAQFTQWAHVDSTPVQQQSQTYGITTTGTFSLEPYQVGIGSFVNWTYQSKTLEQVYKLHITLTKQEAASIYANANDIMFELVDGNGQSMGTIRYALGSSGSPSVPILSAGDQYLTFTNVDWSRYNSFGTSIRVYEAFSQGKRLLGTFQLN